MLFGFSINYSTYLAAETNHTLKKFRATNHTLKKFRATPYLYSTATSVHQFYAVILMPTVFKVYLLSNSARSHSVCSCSFHSYSIFISDADTGGRRVGRRIPLSLSGGAMHPPEQKICPIFPLFCVKRQYKLRKNPINTLNRPYFVSLSSFFGKIFPFQNLASPWVNFCIRASPHYIFLQEHCEQ